MNPSELEFLAEKEMVEIVPKFNLDAIYLMDGNLGPFRAGLPALVPLWVALDFRRRERCTLVPPPWMNVETLEGIKREERGSEEFVKMPNEHYMPLTTVIFRACSQDIPDADKVKILIKDIWDNRISKLRTAILNFLDSGSSFAKVDNLTMLEMATVRPFFPQALEQIHRLRMSGGAATEEAAKLAKSFIDSQSQENSNSENAYSQSQSQRS